MNFSSIDTSITEYGAGTIRLVRDESGKRFLSVSENIKELTGDVAPNVYQLTPENAVWMRAQFPWLNPQPLGIKTSAGVGDRLGVATEGHLRAFKETNIAPILAQQSVRELIRTHRTAQIVMDDAMWGVFEAGWREPWGGDADHLKTTEHMREYFDAGFTSFTIDPGEHVVNITALSAEEIGNLFDQFNFSDFGIDPAALLARYETHPASLDFLSSSPADVKRAITKYGKAILFVTKMYFELRGWMAGKEFDFEVSVDETDDPTTPFEHYLIANELKRLGVKWNSLAPRFIGRFEKGVDYQGDLNLFEQEYKRHAAVQKHFDSYKISLHSGSDKFSIYKICAESSDYMVHLKTAGTSYLEAIRVIAQVDPDLFRKIYAISLDHYETDKQSYHVSAQTARMPKLADLSDDQLPALLDHFDARQALHVCFGTILDAHKAEIMADLYRNHELYSEGLRRHFDKHLVDFVRP